MLAAIGLIQIAVGQTRLRSIEGVTPVRQGAMA
jgi:hypothetical protein